MSRAYGFMDNTLYVIEAQSEDEARRKFLARCATGLLQASLWDVPAEDDVKVIHEGDTLEVWHRWADGDSSQEQLERLAKSLLEERYNFDLPFGCCSQVISARVVNGGVIAVHRRIPRPFWLRRVVDDEEEEEEFDGNGEGEFEV